MPSPDTQTIALLLGAINHLQSQLVALEERCRDLKEKVSKNSSNSSKPPSSDGYQKPNANDKDNADSPNPKSLRESSGLKAGGQKKHKGHCLCATEKPDHTHYHKVNDCKLCGIALTDEKVIKYRERQVFEPGNPGSFTVTAHLAEVKVCPCGHRNQATFPEGVNSYVQYGSVTRAMSVYFCQYQMIPYGRAAELFADMFSLPISTGTICNFQKIAWEQLESTEEGIKAALLGSEVAGADETGMRVDGKLWWLHLFRDDRWSLYYLSKKRGREAMDAMGVLLLFTGVLVHDHWKPYFHYAVTHTLCNAHHLRELQAVLDHDGNYLAGRIIKVLRLAWHLCKGFKRIGLTEMPATIRVRINRIFTRLAQRALEKEATVMERRRQRLGKKKTKNTKAYNLFKRLLKYQEETLRFMTNFKIPFDNNGSERDVRMAKLKQKISGCFRSEDGGEWFTRVRSYLSSAKKQGLNAFEALIMAVQNYNHKPLLGPE